MGRSDGVSRDLLFGLIALQVGLIDQAQLVAAFQAWTLDKSRSLADHLTATGHLDAADRAGVETMVALHLKRHRDDPEQSLASLGIGRSTRERLVSLDDPDLDATLSFVGADAPAAAEDADPDRTPTSSPRVAAGERNRFQILRPHAEGGLGIVSVALDRELGREVALKEIRDSHADVPSSRRRFLLEAEITGGLEHPGIVPVYGLGRHENGRPYYAMRLIRGESLRQAIGRFHLPKGVPKGGGTVVASDGADRSAWALGLQKLLRRFLDVCNAVDYAHARGVLHRDLKPSNVIVGKHGETLVVDWGLAKATGKSDQPTEEGTLRPPSTQDSVETLPGSAFGTPSYMSPEQAQGDLEAIGPRSDVYSLGATLYCLMTGRPPIEKGTPDEMRRRVQSGAYPKPRQVDPSIDKGLEAICLKAMALRPDQRYASCRALADDVELWLADEPVSARRESLASSLGRWSRRHRTVVATAAAALMIATAALGAISVVQTQARADLAQANTALDRQRRFAEAQELLAVTAVKHFRDAVVDNAELKRNPALGSLRTTLLKEPLAFFADLRERIEASGDPRPQSLVRVADAAHDHAHLADEIGDREDALRLHAESQEIWERLTRDDPENLDYQKELGRLHSCKGDLLRATGQPEAAMRAFEESRVIRQKLVDTRPESLEFASALANAIERIATLHGENDQVEEAIRNHEAAFAIRERQHERYPDVAESHVGLANSLNNIGALLLRQEQYEQALSCFLRAVELRRGLAAALSDDESNLAELAGSYNNLGITYQQLNRLDDALKALQEAARIKETLAQDQPTVTERQVQVASSYYNIGTILTQMRRPNDAARAFEKALGPWETLAREHPESPEYASSLGATLNNLATMEINANRLEPARDRLKRAVAAQKQAMAANPRNPRYREALVSHLGNLVSVASGLGHRDEAVESLRELKEVAAGDSRFHEIITQLVAATRLDLSQEVAERLDQADRALRQARYSEAAKLLTEAIEAEPKVTDDRQRPWRYFAARAALMTASGNAKDEPNPDQARSASLRAQALGWLKAELAQWEKDRALAPLTAQKMFADALDYWNRDTMLGSVRGEAALVRLPEEERQAWKALWADVAALLAQIAQ